LNWEMVSDLVYYSGLICWILVIGYGLKNWVDSKLNHWRRCRDAEEELYQLANKTRKTLISAKIAIRSSYEDRPTSGYAKRTLEEIDKLQEETDWTFREEEWRSIR